MGSSASTEVSKGAATGRRDRKAAATRARIAEAAVRLFSQHGLANTTVEAITKAADVGKGTFFAHFPSKTHLVKAFVDQRAETISSLTPESYRRESARETLRMLVHALYSDAGHGRLFTRALFGAVLSDETLTQVARVQRKRARVVLARCIQQAQLAGELRAEPSPGHLAKLLQQLVIGTIIAWSLSDAGRLAIRIDDALDLFWRGAAATPPSTATRSGRRAALKRA